MNENQFDEYLQGSRLLIPLCNLPQTLENFYEIILDLTYHIRAQSDIKHNIP
jgi:hypothetical protein